MFKHLATIAAVALLLGGCSVTPGIVKEKDVVIVDPEKFDQHIHGNIKYEPTPDHVVVGEKDGVIIEVHKREVIKDELADDIQLQVWDAAVTNLSQTDKCVTPLWRLMDFEYISDGPSERLVKSNQMVHLGQMQQKTWVLDGVVVAPPPSGYLADLRVRGTVPNAKPGEECIHLVDEDKVEEQ